MNLSTHNYYFTLGWFAQFTTFYLQHHSTNFRYQGSLVVGVDTVLAEGARLGCVRSPALPYV